MDPIAKTAYYCCGARDQDAHGPNPVCGDDLAARFMDAPARRIFERFAHLKDANVSNAARHRIIDDLLRDRLSVAPRLPVFLLGAGFDTRAFRLRGGDWVEFDQPALMRLKDEKLPARESPNPLHRVRIDFAKDSLEDKLAPWRGTAGAVVVMEGVSMYLQPAQLEATARTLQRLLPGHSLLCDLFDATFDRLYGGKLRAAIAELGGGFVPARDDPPAALTTLGYRQTGAWSIVGRAVDHGALRLPRWLLDTLFRSLRDGYRVYRFEAPVPG